MTNILLFTIAAILGLGFVAICSILVEIRDALAESCDGIKRLADAMEDDPYPPSARAGFEEDEWMVVRGGPTFGGNMSDFYILDDEHNLIPTDDIRLWGDWFKNNPNRIVAKTSVGNTMISTVCLGIDHNFHNIGPPLLFETMLFVPHAPGGGQGEFGEDNDSWRCSTWAEAEAQHAEVVAEMRAMLGTE